MLKSCLLLELSTVIVNWNSGAWLPRLLTSLQPLRSDLQETLVVDNASVDGSANAVSAFPGVRLERSKSNLGFAGAANLGIRKVASPMVMLLNPDLEVIPSAVGKLYSDALPRTRVAITCGELLGLDGLPQAEFQFRPLPTASSVIRDALFIDELLGRPRRVRSANLAGSHQLQPAAAFWILRREAWEDLGGFDERFHPAWFEDVDFCLRSLNRGWQIRCVPVPCAVHGGGHTLDRLGWNEFLRYYNGNLIRYWRKHHRRSLVPVWIAVRLGEWARRMAGRR